MGESVDLSRPKILNHLIKGGLFGLAARRLAPVATAQDVPWCYLLLVLVYLFTAVFLRNLHALAVRPKLELSPQGIRLRYWKPTRFLTWAMFLPWNRVVSDQIAWQNFRGCTTLKSSGGDPWDAWEGLNIDTSTASHTIGWDVFAGSVSRLEAEITGYLDTNFRSSDRDAGTVAEFNRKRFAVPLKLQHKSDPQGLLGMGCGVLFGIFIVPLMVVLFGAIGSLAGLAVAFVAMFAPKFLGVGIPGLDDVKLMDDVPVPLLGGKAPVAIQIGVVGGILVGGIVILRAMLSDRAKERTRTLHFTAEGLAYGRNPESLRLVPWDAVLYAKIVTTTTHRNTTDGSSSYTSHRLEVHLRNQAPLVPEWTYGREYSEICELIDPPAEKLALARRYLAGGMDIETAARAAGLPAA